VTRKDPDQLHSGMTKASPTSNASQYHVQTPSASTFNIKNVTNCNSFFNLCHAQVEDYASNCIDVLAAVEVSFHLTASFKNRKRMSFCVENKLIQSNDCVVPKEEV